ncbi:MAG: DUF5615 family PIN-like protein [Chloroflexota bacterium]
MPLKIYTDESVPVAVAAGLKRRGVDAYSARDKDNLSLTDEQQLTYTSVEKMVLFSHDDDFLRLTREWQAVGKTHWGIVYVHQHKLSTGDCIRKLKQFADLLSHKIF